MVVNVQAVRMAGMSLQAYQPAERGGGVGVYTRSFIHVLAMSHLMRTASEQSAVVVRRQWSGVSRRQAKHNVQYTMKLLTRGVQQREYACPEWS